VCCLFIDYNKKCEVNQVIIDYKKNCEVFVDNQVFVECSLFTVNQLQEKLLIIH